MSAQEEGIPVRGNLPHPEAEGDHFRALPETAARGGDADGRTTLGDSDWRLQAQHQVVATPSAGGQHMAAAKRAPAPQRPATTDLVAKWLVGGWLGVKYDKNEAEEAKVEAAKAAVRQRNRQRLRRHSMMPPCRRRCDFAGLETVPSP